MATETPKKPDDLRLAADFPDANHEQWLKLVDKVLAGAPFEKKLVSRTYDGLAIQPLYTRDHWNAEGDPSGFPGGAPFTRGGHVLGDAIGGWDIRQRHSHPDPATANAQILEDLEHGVGSIVLQVDPTGANGVAVQSASDLETVLKGVYVDLAPIVLEPATAPLPMAAVLMDVLEKRGAAKSFIGNFGVDGFATLAATGHLPMDIATALARMGDFAAHAATTFPKARTFNVRTLVHHSAGASEALELGIALATAVEYLRAMAGAAVDTDTACGQIAFTVAADTDFFLTIAKIRALRKLWSRVTEVCGASVEQRTAPVVACTAPRMMSQRDPWVNVLRTTVACFAAGVAGADAITVLPFDAALGIPSDLARRIARNAHVVLQEEASVSRVIDPAGGAWMFERLTDELSEKAWAFFQGIERDGGMGKALASGVIAQKIAAVHAERAQNIARRKDPLTGVSEFPNIHEAKLAPQQAMPAARTGKPSGNVGKLPAPSSGALAKALAAAVRAGANVAAMREALQTDKPVTISPLPAHRLAEGFEHLRDRGDAFKSTYGQRPKIFLANLGKIAEFTARAGYAKNFFEAGGIEAVPGSGGTEPVAIVKDFETSGASFASLCGPDALYSEIALKVAQALKRAGAGAIYLAGRPGEQEAALRAAGVDEFIYIGCDVQGVLERAHQRLEAASEKGRL